MSANVIKSDKEYKNSPQAVVYRIHLIMQRIMAALYVNKAVAKRVIEYSFDRYEKL